MQTNTTFTKFLAVLGIIFLMVILIGFGFFLANGTGSRAFSFPSISAAKDGEADANPMLTTEQEAALRAFGMDPASLPTSITPEMEACFTSTLGADRVAQIKAGDAPSASEFFKAKGCF
jgi:hypothetical protein